MEECRPKDPPSELAKTLVVEEMTRMTINYAKEKYYSMYLFPMLEDDFFQRSKVVEQLKNQKEGIIEQDLAKFKDERDKKNAELLSTRIETA